MKLTEVNGKTHLNFKYVPAQAASSNLKHSILNSLVSSLLLWGTTYPNFLYLLVI